MSSRLLLLLPLALFWAIAAKGCAPRSPVPEQAAWPAGESWTLPTQRCRDFFVVEARINGTGPWRLLLDSGTAETLLRPELRAQVAPAGIDSLRIGDFVARRLGVADQEMAELSHALGLSLDGILGHPVFAGGLVTYDYPAGAVRLSRGRMDATTHALAPTRTRRRPLVRARIGGEPVWVLVDTGSSQGLTLTGLHRFDLAEEPVPTGTRVRVDGLHLLRSAVLAGQVFLGPLHLIRPLVHESPRLDLVGTRVLRHFAVTFDQRRGAVGFTRSGGDVAEPVPPDTLWSLGMAVRVRATGQEVLAVFAGSPAERAGVAPGDRIVAADGRAVDGRRCEAGAVTRPPPSAPVRLMVERAGARREVELTPVPVMGG
jgi:hypothetical protein